MGSDVSTNQKWMFCEGKNVGAVNAWRLVRYLLREFGMLEMNEFGTFRSPSDQDERDSQIPKNHLMIPPWC